MTRIIIIDDDASYLSLCESVAATDTSIAVVATSTTGFDLPELLSDHHADVVMVDLAMPDIDGISLARTAGRNGALVIVATNNDFPPLRKLALSSGVAAVLPKDPMMTLFERVRKVIDERAR